MKKILIILLLTMTLMTGASFAQGFTQYDLSELLINKAKSENLIENKEYSQDEIISFVKENNLFKLTDIELEVSPQVVRDSFSTYELFKLNQSAFEDLTVEQVEVKQETELEKLLKLDRKLSHEFMVEFDEKRWYRDKYKENLCGYGNVENEQFHYEDYIKYPLIDKYRYELYRIMGWYALEYDLYAHQTTHSIELYATRTNWLNQVAPLIRVGLGENVTDDNNDGVAYNVRMKVRALYDVRPLPNDTLETYRNRVVATAYKQAHFEMVLRDVSSIFIEDEAELTAFTASYVEDVVENQEKRYSYDKDRHEFFGDKRYFISKDQSAVFYYIDFDLSKWED